MTSLPTHGPASRSSAHTRLPWLAGGILTLALLGVAVATGPLITLRTLDPATGRVILNDAQGANGQGQNQKFAVDRFDATQYAQQQWALDVVPMVEANQVPLGTLLGALGDNGNAAADRYGVPRHTRAKNFVVSGHARVALADLKSPLGLLTLAFEDEPALAGTKVQLLTGPLVISTVLRDIMPDMSLNNFTNQTQYADVAAALNKVALANAYGQTPAPSLLGKTVDFTGVLNLQSPSSLRIVPVKVTVRDAP
jgi:predicted lipoprotein